MLTTLVLCLAIQEEPPATEQMAREGLDNLATAIYWCNTAPTFNSLAAYDPWREGRPEGVRNETVDTAFRGWLVLCLDEATAELAAGEADFIRDDWDAVMGHVSQGNEYVQSFIRTLQNVTWILINEHGYDPNGPAMPIPPFAETFRQILRLKAKQ